MVALRYASFIKRTTTGAFLFNFLTDAFKLGLNDGCGTSYGFLTDCLF